jgi:hypothetical protein
VTGRRYNQLNYRPESGERLRLYHRQAAGQQEKNAVLAAWGSRADSGDFRGSRHTPAVRSALVFLGCVACGGVTSTDPDPGVNGNGGTGAVEPVETCGEAEILWGEALIVARDCDPLVGDHDCTKLVRADWACGCKTYVNVENAEALKELSTLKKRLDGAAPASCAAECVGDCVDPLYGVCQTLGLGGTTGRCSDVYY